MQMKEVPSSVHFEFSKLIIKRVTLIFLLQMVLTLAVIFFRFEVAQHSVSLMNATIPLYAVIFGGYFGKAGLENYQKIKNNCECGIHYPNNTNTPEVTG